MKKSSSLRQDPIKQGIPPPRQKKTAPTVVIDNALYTPSLGTVERYPNYAPFIRATTNIGGLDGVKLRQIHRYTHYVLATQRHKIDLNTIGDDYFRPSQLPAIQDTFPYLNVTSMRDPVTIFNKSVADALSIIPTIEHMIPEIMSAEAKGTQQQQQHQSPHAFPLHVVDVGSGGGVPGMILAIARPHWHITMVDSVKKKCVFLRHVADALHLKNVTVISGGVQTYTMQGTLAKPIPCFTDIYYNPQTDANPFLDSREGVAERLIPPTQDEEVNMFEKYHICVARGVTAMPNLLPLCLPLVKPGGKFIAMKSLLASVRLDIDQQKLIDLENEKNNKDSESNKRDGVVDKSPGKGDDNDQQHDGKDTTDEAGDNDTAQTTRAEGQGGDVDGQKPKRKKPKKTGPTRDIQIKVKQQQHNESLTDFDHHLNAIINSEWIPQGTESEHYPRISLELLQGMPMLRSLGAGAVVRYVHTDPFFTRSDLDDPTEAAPTTKHTHVRDIADDDDSDADGNADHHSRSIDDMLSAKLTTESKMTAPDHNEDAARYLCIFDKVYSIPPESLQRPKPQPKRESSREHPTGQGIHGSDYLRPRQPHQDSTSAKEDREDAKPGSSHSDETRRDNGGDSHTRSNYTARSTPERETYSKESSSRERIFDKHAKESKSHGNNDSGYSRTKSTSKEDKTSKSSPNDQNVARETPPPPPPSSSSSSNPHKRTRREYEKTSSDGHGDRGKTKHAAKDASSAKTSHDQKSEHVKKRQRVP